MLFVMVYDTASQARASAALGCAVGWHTCRARALACPRAQAPPTRAAAAASAAQIFGRCIAGANSPLDLVRRGLQQWLALGVPASKLVLGLPWCALGAAAARRCCQAATARRCACYCTQHCCCVLVLCVRHTAPGMAMTTPARRQRGTRRRLRTTWTFACCGRCRSEAQAAATPWALKSATGRSCRVRAAEAAGACGTLRLLLLLLLLLPIRVLMRCCAHVPRPCSAAAGAEHDRGALGRHAGGALLQLPHRRRQHTPGARVACALCCAVRVLARSRAQCMLNVRTRC